MKNKFHKLLAILNILITVTLLNSCNGMNGHKNDKAENVSIDCKHEQAKCPSCEGSYRYFYTLADKNIILICEECNCIWVNPAKIDLANATGAKNFEEELFEEESSKWSSKEEVQKSKWADIARENELLIMPVS